MTAIILTGTPCTGKTILARYIAKELNYDYVDVNKIIKDNRLHERYDRRRRCFVVDIKKLNEVLISMIRTKKHMVIDSHMSHHLPKRYVAICIVAKCAIKTLKRRLERRGYGRAKVRENLDAEIFENCLTEAEERKHNIMVVDTSGRISRKKLIAEIRKRI